MNYHGRSGGTARFWAALVFVLASSALLALVSGGCRNTEADLGKDVLATVNGEPVTIEDFKLVNGDVPKKAEDRKDALMIMINNKLASRAAVQQGYMAERDVQSGMEDFYDEHLPEFLLKKIREDTAVTDEDLRPYKEKTEAMKPRFGVSILIAPTMDSARAALDEINKGADFRSVAAKHSTVKGETDTEFGLDEGLYPIGVRAVLNRLKPGELSPIMKLEVGYAIFKLNYRKEPPELWKSSKESARSEVKQKKVEEEQAKLLDGLRSSADVKLVKHVLPGGEVQYLGAEVNGVQITMDPRLFNSGFDPHSPHGNLNPGTLKEALNKRVNNVLLSQEARRRGIDKDPEFQRELKLKKEEILAEAITEKVRQAYEPSPQDIKDYYEKHKERFMIKPSVRLSRILLSSEEDAQSVLKELKGGKEFAAVAKVRSMDGSTRDKGGDVGYIAYDLLKEPLKSAAAGLRVGEVSGVLKSDYGYEVLKATDRKEGGPAVMSTITSMLRKRAKLVKQSEQVEAFYRSLNEKADIKINKKLLESF